MDTRYLQSFVAVAEHGSFAEAAHRLGLTAAAIAARVQALEDSLFGLRRLASRSVVLIALTHVRRFGATSHLVRPAGLTAKNGRHCRRPNVLALSDQAKVAMNFH